MLSWLRIEAVPFGGDLHFHYVVAGKLVRFAVTHGCLIDVFGSDGGKQGDMEVFQLNVHEILHVAVRKAQCEARGLVVLTKAGFTCHPSPRST
ncbi:hypothetical protein AWB76_06275 [Caballeronia temeraria]|uniref:Uncharacterized protein n=1 Tax=Caballeronia temeraria TaxID=1777137 RepID=A0A158D2M2_9BURK|nr:hypothetical protein AWB76_06275 [Caballeronia temeraria]